MACHGMPKLEGSGASERPFSEDKKRHFENHLSDAVRSLRRLQNPNKTTRFELCLSSVEYCAHLGRSILLHRKRGYLYVLTRQSYTTKKT